MTPNNFDLIVSEYGTKTYKIDIENNCIKGFIDNIEALKQMIYKALNTDRFNYIIYSWNYGNELNKLVGEGITYAIPEIERYIKECLSVDNRVNLIHSFEFKRLYKDVLLVTFVVDNIYNEPININYTIKGV